MPFNTTPEIDFSAIGLITDVPSHNLPPGSWSDCLNIRPKDGSVQGVLKFKDSGIELHGDHRSLTPMVCTTSGYTDEASCEDTSQGNGSWIVNPIIQNLEDAKGAVVIAEADIKTSLESIEDDIVSANDTLGDKQALLDAANLALDNAMLANGIAEQEYQNYLSTEHSEYLDATEDKASSASALALITDGFSDLATAKTAYVTNKASDITAVENKHRVRDSKKDEVKTAQISFDNIDTSLLDSRTDALETSLSELERAEEEILIVDSSNLEAYDILQLEIDKLHRDIDGHCLTNIDATYSQCGSANWQLGEQDLVDTTDMDDVRSEVASKRDTLDTKEAQLLVLTEEYLTLLEALEPERTDYSEAQATLEAYQNMYDSLSSTKTKLSDSETALAQLEQSIEEKDKADEDGEKLDDDILTAYNAQLDYNQGVIDNNNGTITDEALEVLRLELNDANNTLYTTLENYSYGITNEEAIVEANTLITTTTETLDEILESFGATTAEDAVTEAESNVSDDEDLVKYSKVVYRLSEITEDEAQELYDQALLDKDAADDEDDGSVAAGEVVDAAVEALAESLVVLNTAKDADVAFATTINTELVDVWDGVDATYTTYKSNNADYEDTITDFETAKTSKETLVDTAKEDVEDASDVVDVAKEELDEISLSTITPTLSDALVNAKEDLVLRSDEYDDAWLDSTSVITTVDENIFNGDVVALTQFTPAGENNLVIAYIVKGEDDFGHVIIHDTVANTYNDVSSSLEEHRFTFDSRFKPQIFVFNGCLVVNPATDCPPLWCEATVAAGSLTEIPDWFNDYYKIPGTDEQQIITISGYPQAGSYESFLSIQLEDDLKELTLYISDGDTPENLAKLMANLIGPSAVADNNTITVTFPSSMGDVPIIKTNTEDTGLSVVVSTLEQGQAPEGTPLVTRVLRSFNNRLVAMNIREEKDPDSDDDDAFLPIDFLWSGNIKGQGTLEGLEWAISSVNSAGDSFLTQTPGKIVDGMQLGPYFVVYKEDSVVQVYETGNAFILGFNSVFEDDGIYSSGCVAPIGNSQHLTVGNFGVYIHDGQTQKQHIAKGIFQDFLFKAVEPAHRDRSFVFHQTRDKEIWFCYSSVNNDKSGCNGAFVFDYETQRLHRRTLPNVSSMYETELNGVLKIYAATDEGIQILDPDSYVNDGYFERINENLQSPNFKTITGCSIKSDGSVKVSTGSTKNINDTFTYSDVSFDPGEDYKVNFRQNGRYLSLKVSMVDSDVEGVCYDSSGDELTEYTNKTTCNTNSGDWEGEAINPKLTTISFDMKETSRR